MPSSIFLTSRRMGCQRRRACMPPWRPCWTFRPGVSPGERAARFAVACRPAHGAGDAEALFAGRAEHLGVEFGVEVRLLDDRLLDTLDA